MRRYLVPVRAAWKHPGRYAAIAVSALALAGCETKLPTEMSHTEAKQLAMTIYQRWVDQGVAPGSAEMKFCTDHETRREIDKRFSNRAALRGIGQGLQNAADNRRRRVTCTSTAVGHTVRTTCL